MQSPKKRITMKTIAEEAGVTLATVSRILGGKGEKYAEKTKRRIIAIADRYKYRPNALVRGMQSGVTRTAGVMMPSSGFYGEIIAGIHDVFLQNNTIMLLAWNPVDKHSKSDQQERHIIHQMIDRRVDGLILRTGSEDFERSYFEEIWERNIPLIVVDRELAQVPTDFVGTDDKAVGMSAAQHLMSLGHRRLLFVGDSPEVSTSRYREQGFRKVLSESVGVSCICIDYDNGNGAEAVQQCIQSSKRPTGVFCYNDKTAEEVFEIITRAGLSVPRDVSLVGCGNTPKVAFPLPLTTFDQHPFLIGKSAAELYMARTYGKQTISRRELIPAGLIVRASTSAPSI